MNDDTDKLTEDSGRKPDGTFAPGNALGGSRQGRANKLGVTIKAEILEAYEGKGGVAWLAALPDALFVALLGKCLPRDQKLEVVSQCPQLNIIHYADYKAEQRSLREAPDDGEAMQDLPGGGQGG